MSAAFAPGRSCPLSYRYDASSLAGGAALLADTLYVVGGLYGNPFALVAVLEAIHSEPGGASLVFNGDFNWFNAEPREFKHINQAVLAHIALRGNVETEIALSHDQGGCGCGYPDWVSDAEVERSNRIMQRLQETAAGFPELRTALGRLPMVLKADVGGLPVGIVHGDAQSLAGWDFSQESLRETPSRARLQLARSGVRVMASSHSCLPVAQMFDLPQGRGALFNNGAAGMPNFRGASAGLATRISVRPAAESLYGVILDGVHIDAVPIRYDARAWLTHFDHAWPKGSPAADSYRSRLVNGPSYPFRLAARRGIVVRGGAPLLGRTARNLGRSP